MTDQSEADAAVERLTDVADRCLFATGEVIFGVHRATTLAADLRLLLAERMALREVLMPFAHRGENPNAVLHDDDFRRARSALQGNGGAANPPS